MIVNTFDNNSVLLVNLISKLQYLNNEKDHWAKLINSNNHASWFESLDEDTLKMMWDKYIKKIKNTTEIRMLDATSSFEETINQINPINHNERVLASYAIFLNWDEITNIKDLYLQKIKKFISIKKHRQKKAKDGKIAYQVYISKKTKERLTKLANDRGISHGSYLEYLISQSYKSEKNKK